MNSLLIVILCVLHFSISTSRKSAIMMARLCNKDSSKLCLVPSYRRINPFGSTWPRKVYFYDEHKAYQAETLINADCNLSKCNNSMSKCYLFTDVPYKKGEILDEAAQKYLKFMRLSNVDAGEDDIVQASFDGPFKLEAIEAPTGWLIDLEESTIAQSRDISVDSAETKTGRNLASGDPEESISVADRIKEYWWQVIAVLLVLLVVSISLMIYFAIRNRPPEYKADEGNVGDLESDDNDLPVNDNICASSPSMP